MKSAATWPTTASANAAARRELDRLRISKEAASGMSGINQKYSALQEIIAG
jgi:hypothetical protein